MTIREMIDAMLAGETLIRPTGATAYYDPDDEDFGPWVYVGLAKARMVDAWYYTYWSIKPKAEPKPSPRDRMMGFCTNTPGIVVRFDKGDWEHPGAMDYSGTPDDYEWTTVDIYGHYGEPHKFDLTNTERS